jgi:hypothetical protein
MSEAKPPEAIRRLLPEEPFPPYAFVPGRFPHPETDPAGHSYGIPRPTPPPLDPEDWQASRTYLRGLDLFNAQFFWESHVEFEALWHACGRRGVVAEFLKGLIRLAAAGVKHREGKPQGVKSHGERAAQLWRRVGETGSFCGLRLDELITLAEGIAREGWPATAVNLVPTR